MENRKVKFDSHTNLLQLEEHMYPLVDVKTPNVFHNLFPYEEVPKIAFNDRIVPHHMPDEIWITDTTFRDGQQSRAPYTTEQIVRLYDYMHRLGGPKGKIRQCEFFLYSKKDRDAVYKCLEHGYVIPFCLELMKLSKEYQIPIKVRCCDTMGYGVNYAGAVIPRSVQGIIYGLMVHAGVPSEMIEWHGHNDFYKAVSNSTTAWLYGASGVNCSLFGIGERTGNTPLEAMVFEYAQLRGTLDGMDTTVITEMADYYEKEIGYRVPSRTPFVGSNFNVTRAGIHADGLLKNEEIYNIFNTQKFLNRPAMVAVSNTSGLAGIAHWINSYYRLPDEKKLTKDMPLVSMVKEWVDKQYEEGRVTVITDNELVKVIDESCKKLSIALV